MLREEGGLLFVGGVDAGCEKSGSGGRLRTFMTAAAGAVLRLRAMLRSAVEPLEFLEFHDAMVAGLSFSFNKFHIFMEWATVSLSAQPLLAFSWQASRSSAARQPGSRLRTRATGTALFYPSIKHAILPKRNLLRASAGQHLRP